MLDFENDSDGLEYFRYITFKLFELSY